LVCDPISRSSLLDFISTQALVLIETHRHNQSTNAALAASPTSRRESSSYPSPEPTTQSTSLTPTIPQTTKRGFLATGLQIINRETPLALYKGIGAVTIGIIPKMAIRFTSYEYYKELLTSPDGTLHSRGTFMAGLAAGVTEAVAVVTPMEVVKIRLQAQYHSMSDPLDVPKYRNAAHACYTVVREEGVAALYRGVTLTGMMHYLLS